MKLESNLKQKLPTGLKTVRVEKCNCLMKLLNREAQMEPQSETTTLFRLLFPSSKTGSLIGKLGSVPGAKVQFDYPTHGDECVIVILADPNPQSPNQALDKAEGSPAQQALVRVFKRMVDELGEAENNNGSVCCRLLIGASQVGCVLGRGGKMVEKIRQESGAQVRVFPRDQIPPAASPGDELIQVMLFFCLH